MIIHQNTLVSEELFEEEFVCNLSACKGACCIEGDGGAPLTKEEAQKIGDHWEPIKSYLSADFTQKVEQQGFSVKGWDGGLETPLNEGKECLYVSYQEDGSLRCAIEQAEADGKINFPKPESCALYPIRIVPLPTFESLRYHRWEICSDACSLGKELQVPIYKFLKKPLIQKYGTEWYEGLELIAENYLGSKT
ncbi:MAG: DUF3109 family protein [Flavobacteriales bacterium]|jgi:hypothetical protein|nr:DUF3109 family protein [Flavobacteriales bacterium]